MKTLKRCSISTSASVCRWFLGIALSFDLVVNANHLLTDLRCDLGRVIVAKSHVNGAVSDAVKLAENVYFKNQIQKRNDFFGI